MSLIVSLKDKVNSKVKVRFGQKFLESGFISREMRNSFFVPQDML